MSNAEAMLKPPQSKRVLKQLDVEVEVDTDVEGLRTNVGTTTLLPATAKYHVGACAQQIATESVKRMDEMALIGYPILSPEQRSVYEVVIRQVVEGIDS